MLQANIFDADGNGSLEPFAPLRMVYIWGATGVPTPDGYVDLVIASNAVTPDLSLGLNFKLIINQATQVIVHNPILTGGAIVPGATMALYVLTDGTDGRLTPDFTDTAWGTDVQAQLISGTANSRNPYLMTFHDDNLWHMDAPVTPS